MNYYPFHIGDFAAHTSHLTWEEDIAYRRMLDWYYLNEKALPLDKTRLARLIRMPKSAAAIDTVLAEFFVESDDGWHNKRADQELTSMLVKQGQQATKEEHEAERLRRHRDRRAEMFAALRDVQIVPAWDLPMKELQRLFDANCNAPETPPETDLQRVQAVTCNGLATAIFTNTNTNTNTNTSIKEERAQRKRRAPTLVVSCPDDVDPQIWQDWHKLRTAKRAPVTDTVVAGARAEAVKAGMALSDFLIAWCRRGSQGLEASWLKPEERINAKNNTKPKVYHDISGMDYTKGVTHDGRF